MDMSSSSHKAAAEYLTEGKIPRAEFKNGSVSPFECDKNLPLEDLLKKNA